MQSLKLKCSLMFINSSLNNYSLTSWTATINQFSYGLLQLTSLLHLMDCYNQPVFFILWTATINQSSSSYGLLQSTSLLHLMDCYNQPLMVADCSGGRPIMVWAYPVVVQRCTECTV